ncbi:hypothetical protein llap_15032 [Limosa lapponica baueri]|uniref:Uncharacterized protein n=1 Tax=Limosa lapponica baueri TaxID=1758121 RepID=A0A2I0TLG1_LIMLA|nr:hypothetical protein llap_15032 [Limosa lapponica baueri]
MEGQVALQFSTEIKMASRERFIRTEDNSQTKSIPLLNTARERAREAKPSIDKEKRQRPGSSGCSGLQKPTITSKAAAPLSGARGEGNKSSDILPANCQRRFETGGVSPALKEH